MYLVYHTCGTASEVPAYVYGFHTYRARKNCQVFFAQLLSYVCTRGSFDERKETFCKCTARVHLEHCVIRVRDSFQNVFMGVLPFIKAGIHVSLDLLAVVLIGCKNKIDSGWLPLQPTWPRSRGHPLTTYVWRCIAAPFSYLYLLRALSERLRRTFVVRAWSFSSTTPINSTAPRASRGKECEKNRFSSLYRRRERAKLFLSPAQIAHVCKYAAPGHLLLRAGDYDDDDDDDDDEAPGSSPFMLIYKGGVERFFFSYITRAKK
uniref:Uncharacterized protein n=1 Tax=Trichogramma kaykai TaxID=54128 RepID=A0ABD2XPW6_9HYME